METPRGRTVSRTAIDPWVALVVVNLLSIDCRAMIIGAVVQAVLVRGDVGVADRRITRTPQSTGDRRFASALSTFDVDELHHECG